MLTVNIYIDMASLIKEDSGIAYGIYAVGMFILLAGAFLVFLLPIFNTFISTFNIFISQGMVSSATADGMNFDVLVIEAMVIFILLGVAMWGVVRALEKKQLEG